MIRPTSELTIDGKIHRLRYTHRDFAVAQHLLKKQGWDLQLLGPKAKEFWDSLNDIESIIVNGESIEAFAPDHFSVGVLLYVGMIHGDRTLTLEQAQDMITFQNFWDIAVPLYRAAVESLTGLTIEEAAKREQGVPNEDRPLASGNGGASAGELPANASTSEPGPNPEGNTMSSGTSHQQSLTHSGSSS